MVTNYYCIVYVIFIVNYTIVYIISMKYIAITRNIYPFEYKSHYIIVTIMIRHFFNNLSPHWSTLKDHCIIVLSVRNFTPAGDENYKAIIFYLPFLSTEAITTIFTKNLRHHLAVTFSSRTTKIKFMIN